MRTDLLPESLEKFTQRMQRYLEIGRAIVSEAAPRINENERLYENIPEETDVDIDTIAQIEMPIVRSLVDTMAAHVMAVITSNEPVVGIFSKGASDEVRAELQDVYEYALHLADWRRAVMRAITKAAVQNQAVVRVYMDDKPLTGISPTIELIDARDLIVLPNTPGRIWEKKVVLARKLLTLEELRIMQNRGIYRPVDISDGFQGLKHHWSQSSTLRADDLFGESDREDKWLTTVAVWDGIIKLPRASEAKKARRAADTTSDDSNDIVWEDTSFYVVTVEESTGAVLRFMPYPYEIHQFVDLTFTPSTVHYRSHTGMVTLLQPIQHHSSKLMNVAIDAAALQARPPIAVKGIRRSTNQIDEYGPGDIMYVDGDVQPIALAANAAPLIAAVDLLWQQAQRLVHLTDMDLGAALRGAETLGEVQMTQARAGAAFDELYIEPVAGFVERICLVLKHILLGHWDEFVMRHNAALPENVGPDTMSLSYEFRVMSRSLRALPAMRMQEVMRTLDIFSLGPLSVFANQYELAREFIQTLYLPKRDRLLLSPEEAAAVQQNLAQQATPHEEMIPPDAAVGAMPPEGAPMPPGEMMAPEGPPPQEMMMP
jgi:hypothetical protein